MFCKQGLCKKKMDHFVCIQVAGTQNPGWTILMIAILNYSEKFKSNSVVVVIVA